MSEDNNNIKEQEQQGKHEAKEETSKKKHKKRISKKAVVAIFLAAIIAICGGLAKHKESPEDLSDTTIETILDENGDNLSLDEILENEDEKITVSGEQVQIMEAIKKLETIIEDTQVYEDIESLNLDKDSITELTDEEKAIIDEQLANDSTYIETLISTYKDGNKIEKARTRDYLAYIQSKYVDEENWKKENGIPVLKSLLTRTVTSTILDAYWDDEALSNYKIVEIQELKDESMESLDFGPFAKPIITLTLVDSKSQATDKVKLPIIFDDETRDAYKVLYEISNIDTSNLDDEKLDKYLSNGLNAAKRCMNKSTDLSFGGLVYTHKVNKTSSEETTE